MAYKTTVLMTLISAITNVFKCYFS